jgi:tetratricopeptide (TPR) repeat protein
MDLSKYKLGSRLGRLAAALVVAVFLVRPAPSPAGDKPEHWIPTDAVFWLLKGQRYAKIAADANWSLDTNPDTTAYDGPGDILPLLSEYEAASTLTDDVAIAAFLGRSKLGWQQVIHALRDNPRDPETLATFRRYIREEVNQQRPEDREKVEAALLGVYAHYLYDGYPGIHPPLEGPGHGPEGKEPDLAVYNPEAAAAAISAMFRELLQYFREAHPDDVAAIEQRLADQLGKDWSRRVDDVSSSLALSIAAAYMPNRMDINQIINGHDNRPPTTGEFNQAVANAEVAMNLTLTGPKKETFLFKDPSDKRIGFDDHMEYKVGNGKMSLQYALGTSQQIQATFKSPVQALLDNPKTRRQLIDSVKRQKLLPALWANLRPSLSDPRRTQSHPARARKPAPEQRPAPVPMPALTPEPTRAKAPTPEPTPTPKPTTNPVGRGVAGSSSASTGKRVVTVDRGPKAPAVGGIRLAYDARLLSQAWALEGIDGNDRLIRELAGRFKEPGDPGKEAEVLAEFANRVRGRIKSQSYKVEHRDLAVVSLRSLLERVEPFHDRWSDLPAELRTPGRLGRVHGYVISPEGDDLLIVGSRSPDGQALDLDDLIVAVQSVWRDGGAPTCSLDPASDDWAARRKGPQKSRVAEVPGNCGFARAMLEADYSMKKILFGTEPVNVPGFTPLPALVGPGAKLSSRFWFYPSPFRPGGVQIAGDGQAALFDAGLEVRTEQVVVGRGGLEGTGQTDEVAERAAASLNEHLDAVTRGQPHFRKLRVLNDLVTLCVLWRELGLRSPLLDRLAKLPHRTVEVPAEYDGLRVDFPGGYIVGGVQLRTSAGPRSWLVLDDAELDSLRRRSATNKFSDGLGADLPGLSVHLPRPRPALDVFGSPSAAAVAKLDAEDFDGALAEADRIRKADPDSPLPLVIRSVAHFARGELSPAQQYARLALRLNPADARTIAYVADVLGYSSALVSRGAASIVPGKGLVARLDEKEAALLRGTALLRVGRGDGARRNLEKAIALDPNFAVAHARLALLESSQGELVKGKNLARKARALRPDSFEVAAILAFAEVKLHHLETAEALAREVLGRPDSDMQSRALAFQALIGASAAREAWAAAKGHLTDAAGRLPEVFRLSLCCYAAEQAELLSRRDLTAEFMQLTEGPALEPASAPPVIPAATVAEPTTVPANGPRPTASPPPDQPLWLWLSGGIGVVVLVGLAFRFGLGRGKRIGNAKKS